MPAVEIPSPLHLGDAVRIFRERGFDLLIADASTEAGAGRADDGAGLSQPAP